MLPCLQLPSLSAWHTSCQQPGSLALRRSCAAARPVAVPRHQHISASVSFEQARAQQDQPSNAALEHSWQRRSLEETYNRPEQSEGVEDCCEGQHLVGRQPIFHSFKSRRSQFDVAAMPSLPFARIPLLLCGDGCVPRNDFYFAGVSRLS